MERTIVSKISSLERSLYTSRTITFPLSSIHTYEEKLPMNDTKIVLCCLTSYVNALTNIVRYVPRTCVGWLIQTDSIRDFRQRDVLSMNLYFTMTEKGRENKNLWVSRSPTSDPRVSKPSDEDNDDDMIMMLLRIILPTSVHPSAVCSCDWHDIRVPPKC